MEIENKEREKAKELVEKFLPYVKNQLTNIDSPYRANKCALIVVDEILKELYQLRKPEYAIFVISYVAEESMDGHEKIAYYETIKEEINKL